MLAHLPKFALRQRQLGSLRIELAREHRHALAMLGSKLLGNLDRFPISNSVGQLAPSLRVLEFLPLLVEPPLGIAQLVAHLHQRSASLDDGIVHSSHDIPGVAGRSGSGQNRLDRFPELFEH